MARNGFAVRRSRWHLAAIATASSVVQSVLGFAQQVVYGRQILNAPIRRAPVFILGHWRSGTTLLHELLACDPRHAAPTTYDCFNPHHFLLTRSWLPTLLRRFAPSRRPMDAMMAGWNRPQEDEFALLLLGQPSPYERIAFPDRPNAGDVALDLRCLSPPARRTWERTLYRLVQGLTLANGGRRLILKSPPHTGRVPTLLKLFPDARFIHIVRDPYAVYSSTLNLWRALFAAQGLQRASWEDLDESILDTFSRLHQSLTDARGYIPCGRFYQMRYEDLVRNPIVHLEAIYRDLELGDFDPIRQSVEKYLAGVRGHEVASHMLTEHDRKAINDRWGSYFKQYGYPMRSE